MAKSSLSNTQIEPTKKSKNRSKNSSKEPKHIVFHEMDYATCWISNGYIVWPICDPVIAACYRRKVYSPPKGWKLLLVEPTNYETNEVYGCLRLR